MSRIARIMSSSAIHAKWNRFVDCRCISGTDEERVPDVMTSLILVAILPILSRKKSQNPSHILWFSVGSPQAGRSSACSSSLITFQRPRISPSDFASLMVKCRRRNSLMRWFARRQAVLYARRSTPRPGSAIAAFRLTPDTACNYRLGADPAVWRLTASHRRLLRGCELVKYPDHAFLHTIIRPIILLIATIEDWTEGTYLSTALEPRSINIFFLLPFM